jgi:hypothetical protein
MDLRAAGAADRHHLGRGADGTFERGDAVARRSCRR